MDRTYLKRQGIHHEDKTQLNMFWDGGFNAHRRLIDSTLLFNMGDRNDIES